MCLKGGVLNIKFDPFYIFSRVFFTLLRYDYPFDATLVLWQYESRIRGDYCTVQAKNFFLLLFCGVFLFALLSVYYVAVRTIVLSRHGSNLARPVIIHNIIDDWPYIYMCQVLHVVDFVVSRRMETAPTSIEVILRPAQSQSDEPSDLRGSLSPTSVYSTWQSQAVTHPIMNRALHCLTSVIEHKPSSEHRIPYKYS